MPSPPPDYAALAARIKTWDRELGFQPIGIAGIDLREAERRFADWLKAGFHGEMAYMARHGAKRSRPEELVPGTVRVISARLDYLPEPRSALRRCLDDADPRPRHGLDTATLTEPFGWDEATFLRKTEGSAIRRIGHERWLRNLAVALGNAATGRRW